MPPILVGLPSGFIIDLKYPPVLRDIEIVPSADELLEAMDLSKSSDAPMILNAVCPPYRNPGQVSNDLSKWASDITNSNSVSPRLDLLSGKVSFASKLISFVTILSARDCAVETFVNSRSTSDIVQALVRDTYAPPVNHKKSYTESMLYIHAFMITMVKECR